MRYPVFEAKLLRQGETKVLEIAEWADFDNLTEPVIAGSILVYSGGIFFSSSAELWRAVFRRRR